ncbi:MAG: GNAT family N-acetyltransferase [Pseudomonadota bacterium]|nr:GNAT family N-acetyltransferase [Pseudomonadota bacterium]
MTATTIRTAEAKDEAQWRALFMDYAKFYRAEIPEAAVAQTWKQILDPAHGMKALLAEREGKVIGLCNYMFHDNTWSTKPACYLQDLFVDPSARGAGAAKALILACEEAAKAKGAFRLYWHTQEFNAPARSLYDTLAQRTSFIVYRKPL